MNTVIVFDLRGSLAHYRRPDTLGKQASYPFIPRTALRGLLAAVLGLAGADELPPDLRTGLRLLTSVQTVSQQMSLHGKKWIGAGPNESFHRPTTMEFVVAPHYRIFCAGPRTNELATLLEERQSIYHTYLGSAFSLTVPEWKGTLPAEIVLPGGDRLTCNTVVPSAAIRQLSPEPNCQYARVGGILHEYVGNRSFRGTISIVYEVTGKAVTFVPTAITNESYWSFQQVAGEGTVCLW